MDVHDVIIIGSGAAGFAAGIYSVRYNLKTLVVGKDVGGQIAEAFEIDNYPGLPGVKGVELVNKFKEHAEKLGVNVRSFVEVSKVEKKKDSFLVTTSDNEQFYGKTVIFATGSGKRKMNIPGEKELAGRGVSYCATCDATFFRDKTVAVVGGGNVAVKSAIVLSDHAKKVYLIYRKTFDKMRAMPYWKDIAEKNPKIEMIFETVPVQILGESRVESVNIKGPAGVKPLKVDGVFVEIGSIPASGIAKEFGVRVDEKGFVIVQNDMYTNIPGVFAAGDLTTGSNHFEQIVTSVSEGAIAANSAYVYLKGGV